LRGSEIAGLPSKDKFWIRGDYYYRKKKAHLSDTIPEFPLRPFLVKIPGILFDLKFFFEVECLWLWHFDNFYCRRIVPLPSADPRANARPGKGHRR
jgi:hypothetical protein